MLLMSLSIPSLLSLLDRPRDPFSSEEVRLLREPPEPSSSSDVVFNSFEELLLLSFEPPFSSEDCFLLALLSATPPAATVAVDVGFAPAFFSP